MPSSPIERGVPAPAEIVALAQRLCGDAVIATECCVGGGNNRVYRVQTSRAAFALKLYGAADDRDRLGHEFESLRFLKACGIVGALPAALAVDRAARCALYEWIDGIPVAQPGEPEMREVLDLLRALHGARAADGAAALPVATEAVLRLSDLTRQIQSRVDRLAGVTGSEPELAAFLNDELCPEIDRRFAALADWDVHAALDVERRTLSPSDFGFHNALRRPDGSLAFIDFEYFGWDDPVKLAADFLWHPAMELSESDRSRFVQGVNDLYGDDPTFAARFAVCYPLYGIRWTLIILNEFLPQQWARRTFAGRGGDWAAAKRGQLRKARTTFAALHSKAEGHFG
jgi:phosphotransferase family enzyme